MHQTIRGVPFVRALLAPALLAPALLAPALLCLPAPARAAVPATLEVQGAMRATGGGAAADGAYSMTFALYDKAVDGKRLYKEGPVAVTVTGGRFRHVIGRLVKLPVAAIAGSARVWLGVSLGNEPELPRSQVHSTLFAVLSGRAADLQCKGCVGSEDLATDAFGPGRVPSAAVSFTYAGSKKKGGPANSALDLQCTGCVSVSELKFDGDIDLGGHGLRAARLVSTGQVVAAQFVGDGSKLTGIQSVAGHCDGKGQVVKGIKPDGTLLCVAALDPAGLPADGLNEISGGLLTNEFTYSFASANTPVPILDNYTNGFTDKLTLPDVGVVQRLDVKVKLTNSNIGELTLNLFDPAGHKYVLRDRTGSGTALTARFPSQDKPRSGDLKSWIGKNPKGLWQLQVIDHKSANKQHDGAIAAWSVELRVRSSKQVEATGDLLVSGVLNASGGLRFKLAPKAPASCDKGMVGYAYYDTTEKALQFCNGKAWFPLFLANPGSVENPGRSCLDIRDKAKTTASGTYWIDPDGAAGLGKPFEVYCDMKTAGGGWTLLGTIYGGDGNHWNTATGYWGDDKTLGSTAKPWQDYKSRAWNELELGKATVMYERRYDSVIKAQATLSNKCLHGRKVFRDLFAKWDTSLFCGHAEITVITKPSDAAGLYDGSYIEGNSAGLDGSGTNGWCWWGGDSDSNIFKGHAGWNQTGYSGQCYLPGHLGYIGVFSKNSGQYSRTDIDTTNWLYQTKVKKTAISFYAR